MLDTKPLLASKPIINRDGITIPINGNIDTNLESQLREELERCGGVLMSEKKSIFIPNRTKDVDGNFTGAWKGFESDKLIIRSAAGLKKLINFEAGIRSGFVNDGFNIAFSENQVTSKIDTVKHILDGENNEEKIKDKRIRNMLRAFLLNSKNYPDESLSSVLSSLGAMIQDKNESAQEFKGSVSRTRFRVVSMALSLVSYAANTPNLTVKDREAIDKAISGLYDIWKTASIKFDTNNRLGNNIANNIKDYLLEQFADRGECAFDLTSDKVETSNSGHAQTGKVVKRNGKWYFEYYNKGFGSYEENRLTYGKVSFELNNMSEEEIASEIGYLIFTGFTIRGDDEGLASTLDGLQNYHGGSKILQSFNNAKSNDLLKKEQLSKGQQTGNCTYASPGEMLKSTLRHYNPGNPGLHNDILAYQVGQTEASEMIQNPISHLKRSLRDYEGKKETNLTPANDPQYLDNLRKLIIDVQASKINWKEASDALGMKVTLVDKRTDGSPFVLVKGKDGKTYQIQANNDNTFDHAFDSTFTIADEQYATNFIGASPKRPYQVKELLKHIGMPEQNINNLIQLPAITPPAATTTVVPVETSKFRVDLENCRDDNQDVQANKIANFIFDKFEKPRTATHPESKKRQRFFKPKEKTTDEDLQYLCNLLAQHGIQTVSGEPRKPYKGEIYFYDDQSFEKNDYQMFSKLHYKYFFLENLEQCKNEDKAVELENLAKFITLYFNAPEEKDRKITYHWMSKNPETLKQNFFTPKSEAVSESELAELYNMLKRHGIKGGDDEARRPFSGQIYLYNNETLEADDYKLLTRVLAHQKGTTITDASSSIVKDSAPPATTTELAVKTGYEAGIRVCYPEGYTKSQIETALKERQPMGLLEEAIRDPNTTEPFATRYPNFRTNAKISFGVTNVTAFTNMGYPVENVKNYNTNDQFQFDVAGINGLCLLEGSPDYEDFVNENGQLMEEQIIKEVAERLHTALTNLNNMAAAKGEKKIVTVPGFGLGAFTSGFDVLPLYQRALERTILRNTYSNIAGVYYSPSDSDNKLKPNTIDVNSTKLIIDKQGLPILSTPNTMKNVFGFETDENIGVSTMAATDPLSYLLNEWLMTSTTNSQEAAFGNASNLFNRAYPSAKTSSDLTWDSGKNTERKITHFCINYTPVSKMVEASLSVEENIVNPEKPNALEIDKKEVTKYQELKFDGNKHYLVSMYSSAVQLRDVLTSQIKVHNDGDKLGSYLHCTLIKEGTPQQFYMENRIGYVLELHDVEDIEIERATDYNHNSTNGSLGGELKTEATADQPNRVVFYNRHDKQPSTDFSHYSPLEDKQYLQRDTKTALELTVQAIEYLNDGDRTNSTNQENWRAQTNEVIVSLKNAEAKNPRRKLIFDITHTEGDNFEEYFNDKFNHDALLQSVNQNDIQEILIFNNGKIDKIKGKERILGFLKDVEGLQNQNKITQIKDTAAQYVNASKGEEHKEPTPEETRGDSQSKTTYGVNDLFSYYTEHGSFPNKPSDIDDAYWQQMTMAVLAEVEAQQQSADPKIEFKELVARKLNIELRNDDKSVFYTADGFGVYKIDLDACTVVRTEAGDQLVHDGDLVTNLIDNLGEHVVTDITIINVNGERLNRTRAPIAEIEEKPHEEVVEPTKSTIENHTDPNETLGKPNPEPPKQDISVKEFEELEKKLAKVRKLNKDFTGENENTLEKNQYANFSYSGNQILQFTVERRSHTPLSCVIIKRPDNSITVRAKYTTSAENHDQATNDQIKTMLNGVEKDYNIHITAKEKLQKSATNLSKSIKPAIMNLNLQNAKNIENKLNFEERQGAYQSLLFKQETEIGKSILRSKAIDLLTDMIKTKYSKVEHKEKVPKLIELLESSIKNKDYTVIQKRWPNSTKLFEIKERSTELEVATKRVLKTLKIMQGQGVEK